MRPKSLPASRKYRCRLGLRVDPAATDKSRSLRAFGLAQPLAIRDKFALHLADQRDRPAKSEQSEAEKIEHHLSHVAFFFCGDLCHVRFLLGGLSSIIEAQVFPAITEPAY